ncbi:MGMT family protein, partial [Actinomadura sp. KC345]|uniref:methylated-DNA--[protein]-cysteine S-methyltransferase n=1 Tax=Actinomadura sp. KC345 TaxID=2530371 RepID=UPI0032605FDF
MRTSSAVKASRIGVPRSVTRAARLIASTNGATRTEFDLPLNLHGTPFQKRVWALLQEIPYGDTATYGQLAVDMGN